MLNPGISLGVCKKSGFISIRRSYYTTTNKKINKGYNTQKSWAQPKYSRLSELSCKTIQKSGGDAIRPCDIDPDFEETSTSSTIYDSSDNKRRIAKNSPPVILLSGLLSNVSFADIKKKITNLRDRIYFASGEFLPIVGTMRISYAKLLQLMRDKKVKRIYLMADGTIGIVEVPFESHASDYQTDIRYDRNDKSIVYVDQKPEWQMEKMRYYIELPGDMWEDGMLMSLVKRNQYHHTQKNRVKYEWILKEHEVTCELVVLDPNDADLFLNNFVGQLFPILGLFVLRFAVHIGQKIHNSFNIKKKDPMEELAAQYARPRAIEYNVGKGAAKNDTGIRFEDVAGIDEIKSYIIEVIRMIKGDQNYYEIGVKPPKGIILEGPPGTGKTYLAKAMAGEGGMPFYSCNGAGFVEMFSGVAASRVKNLFKKARENQPSIIFIDEIDAIGKQRGAGGDSGGAEREAGLLQLLVEMDGYHGKDQVLVIGATNRLSTLDTALTRPGRFDRLIYMGRPNESNRFKILQLHARNKPIPRGGDHEFSDEAVLRRTAKKTIGYTGADLANLLNEAAILSVRQANARSDNSEQPAVTYFHIEEAMEKARIGLPDESLPNSDAKRFTTITLAARAIALAVTPGVPELDKITMLPQGNVLGRILFNPREYGKDGGYWHELGYPGYQVNAAVMEKPQGTFDFCSNLMVPFYSIRAAEEIFFGPSRVTLTSAQCMAEATDLAYYLVAESNLHPAFRDIGMKLSMRLGGKEDPTVSNSALWFERHTKKLQEVAYQRAKRLVQQYRPAIEKVTDIILTRDDETITGDELVSIIKETPLAHSDIPEPTNSVKKFMEKLEKEVPSTNGFQKLNGNGAGQPVDLDEVAIEYPVERLGARGCLFFSGGEGIIYFERPAAGEWDEEFQVTEREVQNAVNMIVGDISTLDLLMPDVAEHKIKQVKIALKRKEIRYRLEAIRKYSFMEEGAKFPPPPIYEGDRRQKIIIEPAKADKGLPDEIEKDVEFWQKRYQQYMENSSLN